MREKALAQIFGLSENEAALYLAGLEYGDASLTELALRAGLPRTAAYYPLEKLMREGFFSATRLGKRTRYFATSPAELEKLLDERRGQLRSLLSELTPAITNRNGTFCVQYFPGPRGIERAGRLFVERSQNKFWYTFEQPLQTLMRTTEYVFDRHIASRVKKHIHAKTIISSNTTGSRWLREHLEKDQCELRETIVVSANEYPIDASLATDGQYTLLIDATREPFATLIESCSIAESFVSLHRIAWDRYKK
jgi:sugar-specific transcriptional regulator TrmB